MPGAHGFKIAGVNDSGEQSDVTSPFRQSLSTPSSNRTSTTTSSAVTLSSRPIPASSTSSSLPYAFISNPGEQNDFMLPSRQSLSTPSSRRTSTATSSAGTLSSRPISASSASSASREQIDLWSPRTQSLPPSSRTPTSPALTLSTRPTSASSMSFSEGLHDQDLGISRERVMLVLQSLVSKQELLLCNQKNMDHKLDLVLDFVRTGENAKKPAGWPTLPLNGKDAFYEWEIFLQDQDSYDFAASHFSIVAGKGHDEGHMAANICKKMLSSALASGLNWAGTELKKGITNMKCGQLIIDVCGKQYKGNFSKSRVSGAVSAWLRGKSNKNEDDDENNDSAM